MTDPATLAAFLLCLTAVGAFVLGYTARALCLLRLARIERARRIARYRRLTLQQQRAVMRLRLAYWFRRKEREIAFLALAVPPGAGKC